VQRILVIDDDELSREILIMLLDSDGYATTAAASGDEALADLVPTDIILTDMQMPGLCGDPLGERLRVVYGPHVRLIAMSGSEVPPHKRAHYDGFLLKPFSVADLEALLAHKCAAAQHTETVALDKTTYASLRTAMTHRQVIEMFDFCLADAQKRLSRMAEAVATSDDALYRREAHTIKGGCGMLGALELRELAGKMETQGLAGDGSEIDNIRSRFTDATVRLRRILETTI
jgi:CheY-like chemotaxis protein/HPt (histidine-containing phosphotransfer) domain-containing protein